MKHILRCLGQALRHPRAAVKGVAEFRMDLTTPYEDFDTLESYDSGRELAHIITRRRFDGAY